MRIAGMVEAVGWDHAVEEEKGRRVMESLREVFADGAMQVWPIGSYSAKLPLVELQGDLVCGAIVECRRSLKAIVERVFINFCDKNAVFTNFATKMLYFQLFAAKITFLKYMTVFGFIFVCSG